MQVGKFVVLTLAVIALILAIPAAIFIAPITAFAAGHHHQILTLIQLGLTGGGLFGAVTINYLYPVTAVGSLPNPNPQCLVIATVQASAAADTSAVITHNFNYAPGEITSGFPMVVIVPQDGNEITSPWYEASENPNFTVLQKSTTAAGGLAKVFVDRRWSGAR
jgi:hypothetical protein